MRLTNFSDYSLRLLIYLGTHDEGLVTIEEIAESYGVSESHLVKVTHHLAQRGYIKTTRGKGGGIRLARSADKINLGKLVRETEENLNLVECFDKSVSKCRIESACVLKGILSRALDQFFAVLDGYTVADLCLNRSKLAKILVLPAPAVRRSQSI